jgi:hypothetical protein
MRSYREEGGAPLGVDSLYRHAFFVPKIKTIGGSIMKGTWEIESEILSAENMVILCRHGIESNMRSWEVIMPEDAPEIDECMALLFGMSEIQDRLRRIEQLVREYGQPQAA